MAISKTFLENLSTSLDANLAMKIEKIEVQPNDVVWVWARPCKRGRSTCFFPMILDEFNQWRVQAAQVNGWGALSSFIEAAANDTVRR